MTKLAVFVVVLLFDHSVTATNTVFTPCSDDSACTGPNEFCQLITWVSNADCTAPGYCSCLPGYTASGDFSGYEESAGYLNGNDCTVIKRLTLGDSCTGNYDELITTLNAVCLNGEVTCDGGHYSTGTSCVAYSGLDEEESCVDVYDCAGMMLCIDSVCRCNDDYKRWDATKSACLNREYGDSCTTDSQCMTYGSLMSGGYTWESGACIDGTCGCAETAKSATFSYFDGLTGVVSSKTICVTAEVNTAGTEGMPCSVDSILLSEQVDYAVCDNGLVCVPCPEQNVADSIGYCRSPVGPKPVTITTDTATTTTSGTTTTTTTTSSTSVTTGDTSTTTETTPIAEPEECAYKTATLYGSGESVCITSENQVIKCEDSKLCSLVEGPSSFASVSCFGEISFTIQSTTFTISKDQLQIGEDGSWTNLADNAAVVAYLARLRKNEGSDGSFFCTTFRTEATSYGTDYTLWSKFPYFYNGEYYTLEIDAVSKIATVSEDTSHYTDYTYPWVVIRDIKGCTSPVCCWIDALYDGSRTEYYYGAGKWQVWVDDSHVAFSNLEYVPSTLNKCIAYFSDLSYTISNGTRYKFSSGSLFQLDGTTSEPLFTVDFDRDTVLGYLAVDPLATGGYYYLDDSDADNQEFGQFYNKTGQYYFRINKGKFEYQRTKWDTQPSCASGLLPYFYEGYKSVSSCAQTDDVYKQTELFNIPCNPSENPSTICGKWYRCEAYFGDELDLTCSMGSCVPDFDKICEEEDEEEQEWPTKKYGSTCEASSECYTSNCVNGVCGCPSCSSKLLPMLEYNYRSSEFEYTEKCLPNNSTVVGEGAACSMWASVGLNNCALGLHCAKCPELWNIKVAQPTCVSLSTVYSQSCSHGTTTVCGYKATCSKYSNVDMCTCPSGYTLEANMIDCYGWNITSQSSCSVTCGNGVKTITRVCDKKSGSTASCSGSETVSVPCAVDVGKCELSAEIQDVAVLVEIQSKVMTSQVFETYIQTPLTNKVISGLNAKCIADKATFESECCPGRAWTASMSNSDCVNAKTGIAFKNFFSDGETFAFYVTAKPNSSSSCCTKAGNRRKRDTTAAEASSYFSAETLRSTLLTSNDLLNSLSQSYDPNAMVASVMPATTVTTAATVASNTSASNTTVAIMTTATDDNKENTASVEKWSIPLIAVLVSCVILVSIVGLCCYIHKRYPGNKTVSSNTPSSGTNHQQTINVDRPLPNHVEEMSHLPDAVVTAAAESEQRAAVVFAPNTIIPERLQRQSDDVEMLRRPNIGAMVAGFYTRIGNVRSNSGNNVVLSDEFQTPDNNGMCPPLPAVAVVGTAGRYGGFAATQQDHLPYPAYFNQYPTQADINRETIVVADISPHQSHEN